MKSRPGNSNGWQGGVTLLEITASLAVLAIGIVGTVSTMLAVSAHRQSRTETNIACKASQEVLEALMGMSHDQLLAQNGVTFAVTAIDPNVSIGSIRVEDVNPANITDSDPANDAVGARGDMTRITVRVASPTSTVPPKHVTLKSMDVGIVAWRTFK